jgi:hypothetical protein
MGPPSSLFKKAAGSSTLVMHFRELARCADMDLQTRSVYWVSSTGRQTPDDKIVTSHRRGGVPSRVKISNNPNTVNVREH